MASVCTTLALVLGTYVAFRRRGRPAPPGTGRAARAASSELRVAAQTAAPGPEPGCVPDLTQCKVCASRFELKRCGRCKQRRYCSSTCQRADWPEHRLYCPGVSAAERDTPTAPAQSAGGASAAAAGAPSAATVKVAAASAASGSSSSSTTTTSAAATPSAALIPTDPLAPPSAAAGESDENDDANGEPRAQPEARSGAFAQPWGVWEGSRQLRGVLMHCNGRTEIVRYPMGAPQMLLFARMRASTGKAGSGKKQSLRCNQRIVWWVVHICCWIACVHLLFYGYFYFIYWYCYF